MKKYIIVTYNVCNMGGGQLYVLRRCKHLLSRGYDILVLIAYDSGYFPLKEQFKGVQIMHVPEIEKLSIRTSRRRKKEIFKQLDKFVSGNKDVYVESHTLSCIEWGEIIASKYNARHLAYSLAEPLYSSVRFSPAKEIIKRKLYAGEFYGCTSISLKSIFKKDLPFNNYVNIGFDADELIEECIPKIAKYKNDENFVITTIGRLSKEYFEPLINDVIRFSHRHPEKKIVLLLVGGSPDQDRVKYLKNTYNNETSNAKNLNIIYTGYIEKLGKDIFKQTDVFVGMGTATINAISQRCLTLIIDPWKDNRTAGFFGVDTANFCCSESGKVWAIDEKLEDVLIATDEEKGVIAQSGEDLFNNAFNNSVCMLKLDDIIRALPAIEKKDIPYVSFFYSLYVNVGIFVANHLFGFLRKR